MRIDDLNCRAVPCSGLVGAIGQDIHNPLSQILLATGSPGSMLAGGSSEFTENIIKIGISALRETQTHGIDTILRLEQ
jgi:hypothetical protein